MKRYLAWIVLLTLIIGRAQAADHPKLNISIDVQLAATDPIGSVVVENFRERLEQSPDFSVHGQGQMPNGVILHIRTMPSADDAYSAIAVAVSNHSPEKDTYAASMAMLCTAADLKLCQDTLFSTTAEIRSVVMSNSRQ